MFLYMVTLYLRIGSMTFPQMVIGRAEVKNHMGRRALLTKTEREAIEDPDNAKYPYVAVSRVRKKIQEELPTDVQILARHHEELHQELIEVVCGDLTPTVRTDVEAKEKIYRDLAEQAEPTNVETTAEALLRNLDLPGRGSKYDARVNTVLEFYQYLREHPNEQVSKAEFRDLVEKRNLDPGYASFKSLWTNWVKKNESQDHLGNTLTRLPGVQMDGDDYVYTGKNGG